MPSTLTAVVVRNKITRHLDDSLYTRQVRRALEKYMEAVANRAKTIAPKFRSDLANSLTPYVSPGLSTAGVRTGSRKAPYVHGRFALPTPPRRRTVPHWPPANQSLVNWAHGHGIPVRLLQLAIWRRGTPIIPFISEAVRDEQPNLDRFIREAADEIEREWDK